MKSEKCIISYSVFGKEKKYTVGMIRNLEIVRELYPEWDTYIFCDRTVPDQIVLEYMQFPKVKVFDASNLNIAGMFWRFLPKEIDPSVERMIVRDADSRPTQREVNAVEEWIEAGTSLHIMRDHPHHNSLIMGGMWGMKFSESTTLLTLLQQFLIPSDLFNRYTDQTFLSQFVYPRFIDDSTIHATFNRFESHAKPFNTPLIDYKFVGEIFEYDETRPNFARDKELLSIEFT